MFSSSTLYSGPADHVVYGRINAKSIDTQAGPYSQRSQLNPSDCSGGLAAFNFFLVEVGQTVVVGRRFGLNIAGGADKTGVVKL